MSNRFSILLENDWKWLIYFWNLQCWDLGILKVIIYWLNRLFHTISAKVDLIVSIFFYNLINENLETEDLCETDLTFNESPLFDCTQFFSSCQPICSRQGFSKSFFGLKMLLFKNGSVYLYFMTDIILASQLY